jgi:hypothetical protein
VREVREVSEVRGKRSEMREIGLLLKGESESEWQEVGEWWAMRAMRVIREMMVG